MFGRKTKNKSGRNLQWSVPTDEGVRVITFDLNKPDGSENAMDALFKMKKCIRVDGEPVVEFGRPMSMWNTVPFQVNNVNLELRFRAVSTLAGASLYKDGERLEPESGSLLSSNVATGIQVFHMLWIIGLITWLVTQYGWQVVLP